MGRPKELSPGRGGARNTSTNRRFDTRRDIQRACATGLNRGGCRTVGRGPLVSAICSDRLRRPALVASLRVLTSRVASTGEAHETSIPGRREAARSASQARRRPVATTEKSPPARPGARTEVGQAERPRHRGLWTGAEEERTLFPGYTCPAIGHAENIAGSQRARAVKGAHRVMPQLWQ